MNDTFDIYEFEIGHLDLMDVRDWEARLIDREQLIRLKEVATLYTVAVGSEIIAVMGHMFRWAGVYEVFIIPSRHIDSFSYKKAFVKAARELLADLEAAGSLVRLQTSALDDDLHNKWMTSIGFESEGIMRKYRGNRDYKMWARLYDGN